MRIIIKTLVQGIIISVMSVYAPQCGLDDRNIASMKILAIVLEN